jgi:phytoene/squalene synthetase
LQVETVADYDLYCHYVAGLVGVGLSQLFGEQHSQHSQQPAGQPAAQQAAKYKHTSKPKAARAAAERQENDGRGRWQ